MANAARYLENLGLTEKEALVYLALYRIGEGTAYEVAKESGLKRPTVYVVLDDLRKRGLALITPHPKKQVFTVKDPHEFILEAQSRFSSDSRALLGFLPSLARPSSGVHVFKGSGALAQGLSYGLHAATGTEVVAFYAGVYPRTKIAPAYEQHLADLGELGFSLRAIVPSNSLDHSFRATDAEFGFKTRKIDAVLFHPHASLEIMGDFVKTIMHKTSEVIVTEDRPTADLFRQLFEVVWRQAD